MTGALDVVAVPRPDPHAQADERALCIDTADCAPPEMRRFRVFNPFNAWDDAWIPVPGSERRSRSVEAVWQGSKIVAGVTDESVFVASSVTKRPPDAERGTGWNYASQRFRFGRESVDIVEARYLLYLPAYLSVIARVQGTDVDTEIRSTIATGRGVRFYDWDDSFDIDDDRAAFSHSALLAAWYGETFEARYRAGVAARSARFAAPEILRAFDATVAGVAR